MLWLIRWGLWLLARLILPLRYRIQCQVANPEAENGNPKSEGRNSNIGFRIPDIGLPEGPVLFLPNHPGYIDPMIVLTLAYASAVVRSPIRKTFAPASSRCDSCAARMYKSPSKNVNDMGSA